MTSGRCRSSRRSSTRGRSRAGGWARGWARSAAPVLRAALAVHPSGARAAGRATSRSRPLDRLHGRVRRAVGEGARVLRDVRAARPRLPGLEIRALPAPAVRRARGAAGRPSRRLRGEPPRGPSRRCAWAGSSTCSRTPATTTARDALLGAVLDGFRAAGRGARAGLQHERAPSPPACAGAGSRAAARPCSSACAPASPPTACSRDRGPLARGLRRQRHGPMSARPPAVLVGIDTEADDQWSARGRQEMGVRNAERLPALQALFDELGVRPTYVVTYEMATRPESAAVLRDLARTGRCEIGTHLHPWSSPPFRPEDLAAHTYPHNLPADLLDRQLTRADGRDRAAARRAAHHLPRGTQRLRRAHAAHPGAARLHRRHQRGPAVQRAAQGRDALRRARPLVPTIPTTRTCAGRARRRSSRSRSPPPPCPRCPRSLERAYARLPPDPLARRAQAPGAAPGVAAPVVHAAAGHARLRRPPGPRGRALLQPHLPLQRAAARGQPLHAGRDERGPLPRRPAARCSPTSPARWARVGRTYAEFAREWAAMNVADGHAAPAAPPGRQRAPAPPARPGPAPRAATPSRS